MVYTGSPAYGKLTIMPLLGSSDAMLVHNDAAAVLLAFSLMVEGWGMSAELVSCKVEGVSCIG